MTEPIKDPGLGSSSEENAKRFVNEDGSFNIKHVNRKGKITGAYSYLLSISWGYFFLFVLVGFLIVNLVFGGVYLLLGIEHITPETGSVITDFFNGFFFSAQTLTTLGYGTLAPKGILFGLISSFEAMIGLLAFAFITGLLYGRFSKPRANIRFSENILFRPNNGNDALMFRMMSGGTSTMIHPKIEVTLVMSQKNKKGIYGNKFYRLKLERSRITYLPSTWTVVHEIDDTSPLYGFNREAISALSGEVLVIASYYEESFNQEVHQMYSYVLNKIKIDYAFKPAFHYDKKGFMILDHNKLDDIYQL